MEQEVREKLNRVVEEQGVKVVFMAKQLQTNYQNLISFKNGRKGYSDNMLHKLNKYLDRFDQAGLH